MADFKTISDKLDKLDTRLDEISIILTGQAKDLQYHIKRSDQADAAIEIVNERVKPIEEHVYFLRSVMKFLSYTAAVVTFFATVYAVLKSK
jgi:tetrahydromethanopterin S-methyltransferase subunit G